MIGQTKGDKKINPSPFLQTRWKGAVCSVER